VGACLGLLAAGGHLTLPANASVAAGVPTEVSTVAADPPSSYTPDQIYVTGATGFLHQYGQYGEMISPLLWTRYADGVTTVMTELAGVEPLGLKQAGGDVVTTTFTVPGHSVSGELTVLDLGTMAWQELPRPVSSDAGYLGFYGGAMVVQTGTAKLALRRFAAEGTYTTTPVTGIPAGTTSVLSAKVGDATGLVLQLVVSGELHYALLDLSTGAVTSLPVQPITPQRVFLTADRIGFFGGPIGKKVMRSYSRNALTDDPQVVSLPELVPSRVALAGTHVIASASDSDSAPAIDYSADGEKIVPVVQEDNGVYQGTDGVLLVGGAGPADWAVHRLTADGKLATVLPLAGSLTNGGLSISQGLLRHVEAQRLPGDPATRYQLFNHTLAVGTDGLQNRLAGGTLVGALPCDTAATCTRTLDGNSYGTAFLIAGSTAKTSVLQTQIDIYTSSASIPIPSAPGRIVDASINYVVVNGSNPAKQYVIDPGQGDVSAGPIGAAALWFDTLWISPKSGYLRAKNLKTGTSATAVRTGAPCVAAELQATGRYVYWSCGANGPAGVYDQARKTSVPVPAGESLLGDGYLVRHDSDSGDLVRYDLATGSAAPVATIARDTLSDARGITWAVDRFGGDIAYVDAADAVHVVDPGVTRTAPAAGIIDTGNSYGRVGFDPNGAWLVEYSLSRPVAAWTMTFAQVSTGKVMSTRTGGPNRTTIFTTWDGYLKGKKKVPSGHYKYTMSVTPTTGAKPVTLDSGIVLVDGGAPNFHSYESTGQPAILGIRKDTSGHWLLAGAGQALSDRGPSEYWHWGSKSSQVSALVPFGDFNNDGNNDLLVRRGSGTLNAYLGRGSSSFGSAKKVTISTGWNRYDAILTSGDLTGDGNADLLARDKKGKLWRYNGTGKKSFSGRVALSGNYKTCTRVIGPGDLNGDGRADLAVIGRTGNLFSAYGTGKGTFGALHKVSMGWSKYNLVISAGDLNEDGHPDLLARDKAGVLWRYLGNGKGGFAGRQKVGTGYQKYNHLF
jgi:hypothetical protein